MTANDTKAPFLAHPWARSILHANSVHLVPGSRYPKHDGEDSAIAETLKTSRTFTSAISVYNKPANPESQVTELSTLLLAGDGMNGHAEIMHGGIVATVLDEGMGILQSVNHERGYARKNPEGQPLPGFGSFTATLDIKYLKPVRTPGLLVVTAKYLRREGRKEWMYAEVRQPVHLDGRSGDREELVCATAEALFIKPKPRVSKM